MFCVLLSCIFTFQAQFTSMLMSTSISLSLISSSSNRLQNSSRLLYRNVWCVCTLAPVAWLLLSLLNCHYDTYLCGMCDTRTEPSHQQQQRPIPMHTHTRVHMQPIGNWWWPAKRCRINSRHRPYRHRHISLGIECSLSFISISICRVYILNFIMKPDECYGWANESMWLACACTRAKNQ